MIYIKNLNLLNVQNIKNVQTANLIYKHKQSLLPPVFNEYFTWGNKVHRQVTRTQQNCISGNHFMKIAKKMLQYQGPYIWNKLPEAVINSQNVFTFKKK